MASVFEIGAPTEGQIIGFQPTHLCGAMAGLTSKVTIWLFNLAMEKHNF
jgi:hypothetical protein